MSLINDALKKAQKQRTGETPSLASMPSVGGETPHRIARRAKPAGFDTLMIRAGLGAGVLLVVIVGGYFAFRSDAQEKRSAISDQPSASVPSVPPVSPDAGSTSAGVTVIPPAPQVSAPAQPSFTLPVAPRPEPAVAKAEPIAPVVQAPAKPTGTDPRVSPFRSPDSPPAQASTPPAASKLEPRAIQFIENIKVAGIMARPTDSKVLMNDRVYRLGSLVEAEMGLTLVGITASSLTFEDERGARYTRTF